MLFNYHFFLGELKSKEDKKFIFEKYSKHYPDIINLSIVEQSWYKDYCAKFTIMNKNELNLPGTLENDFRFLKTIKIEQHMAPHPGAIRDLGYARTGARF